MHNFAFIEHASRPNMSTKIVFALVALCAWSFVWGKTVAVEDMLYGDVYQQLLLNEQELDGFVQTGLRADWTGLEWRGIPYRTDGVTQTFTMKNGLVQVEIFYSVFESEQAAYKAFGYSLPNLKSVFLSDYYWSKTSVQADVDEILFSIDAGILLRDKAVCVLITASGGTSAQQRRAAAVIANEVARHLNALEAVMPQPE